jgi:hypothetical protein
VSQVRSSKDLLQSFPKKGASMDTRAIGEPEIVINLSEPTGSEQNESVCEELMNAISHLWNDERETWFLLGKKLFLLQRERAKPGSGTFVSDVETEIGLPRHTAYRRIDFYRDVKAGKKSIQVDRLLQRAKDGWVVEEDDLTELLELKERQAADERKKAQETLIQQRAEKVGELQKKEKETGVVAPLRIFLKLNSVDKQICKQVYEELGEERVTEIVFHALLQARKEMAAGNAQN